MSYLSLLVAVLPIVIALIKSIFSREEDESEPGKGLEKKRGVLGEVLELLKDNALVGKFFGNKIGQTMEFADGFIDLFVQWQNDMGVFKKTHDVDISPTGGEEND